MTGNGALLDSNIVIYISKRELPFTFLDQFEKMKWRWLRQDVILAIQAEQITEHGGSPGIRDAGLLSSALVRPQNPNAKASSNNDYS